MVFYVPGTEETDPKKQNMSLQQLGGGLTSAVADTATNTAAIATNTTNIATNTTNIATNTASIAAINAAWTAWTPTFSMTTTGGTLISTSTNLARYMQIGKTVFFQVDMVISSVGVGNSGSLLFTLPATMQSSVGVIGATGKEVITLGKLLSVQRNDTTHGAVLVYDNTSLITGGNGTRPCFAGMYEAA